MILLYPFIYAEMLRIGIHCFGVLFVMTFIQDGGRNLMDFKFLICALRVIQLLHYCIDDIFIMLLVNALEVD